MSQEKVDKYKAAKKTRKEDVAREKKQKKLRRLLFSVIGAALVCALILGIVFSIIGKNRDEEARQKEAYQASAYIVPDIAGIQTEDAPTSTEAE
ncbi:MAG: hypothetical protein IJL98_04175 [Lachnospiraceae bacterium]|nr:hypothetical protein [Lachnospiraceae bacterium]